MGNKGGLFQASKAIGLESFFLGGRQRSKRVQVPLQFCVVWHRIRRARVERIPSIIGELEHTSQCVKLGGTPRSVPFALHGIL